MADPTGAFEKGQLYQLELAHLQADPNQPRKFMDPQALEDLAASIGQHGVLMPILFRVATGHDPYSSESGIVSQASLAEATIVSPNSGQANLVVAGERRFEAAKIVGLTTIPAIFVEGNHAEIALVENLLRQDLTAVEEAEALQRLKDEQKYTDEQLGAIIGKARTTLNEALSLNKLPQEIRDECRGDRTITKSTLITIARKKQARAMTTAYNAYKAKQLKKLGDMMKSCPPISRKKDPNDPETLFAMLDKAITKLQSIDTTAWTEEAQANFQTSLANLKIEITNHQAL